MPCPLCHALCQQWGPHLWDSCALAAGAALRGFRAVLAAVSRTHTVVWHTPVWATSHAEPPAALEWRLARDDEAAAVAGTVTVSWSGLVYADCCVVSSGRAADLGATYLDAAAVWLALDPPLRWMSLVTCIRPASAPADVPGPSPSLPPCLFHAPPFPF